MRSATIHPSKWHVRTSLSRDRPKVFCYRLSSRIAHTPAPVSELRALLVCTRAAHAINTQWTSNQFFQCSLVRGFHSWIPGSPPGPSPGNPSVSSHFDSTHQAQQTAVNYRPSPLRRKDAILFHHKVRARRAVRGRVGSEGHNSRSQGCKVAEPP